MVNAQIDLPTISDLSEHCGYGCHLRNGYALSMVDSTELLVYFNGGGVRHQRKFDNGFMEINNPANMEPGIRKSSFQLSVVVVPYCNGDVSVEGSKATLI